MGLRDEPETHRVTIDQLPDLIARTEYMRAEELSRHSMPASMRSWEGDPVKVTIEQLPEIIKQEELRRAYENDRR